MLKRLTIAKKLTLSFAAVLAVTALLAYSSLETIRQLGGTLNVAVNNDTRAADLVGRVCIDLLDMKTRARLAQFAYVVGNVLRIDERKVKIENVPGECSMCHTFDAAAGKQDFTVGARKAAAHADELVSLLNTQDSRKALDVIRNGIAEWQRLFDTYLGLLSSGSFGQAHNLMRDDIGPLLERMTDAADVLRKEQAAGAKQSQSDAASTIRRARWIASVLIAITLVCGIVVLITVRRTSLTLRDLARELKNRARRLSDNAGQVRMAGEALAQGATDQAASIEQTSASSEEVNATARQNSDHSSSVARLIGDVRQQVSDANRVLGETVSAMAEIDRASERISKIIKVVNEIAFQTNILALNAAVEAARAGEAGLGFAVVADEVRGLAQRCSEAARDTEALIGDSVTRSRQGKALLDRLTESIHSITGATESVSDLASQVQTGSTEQARATEEIGQALIRIGQVTQKTAATAQESAAAGEHLTAESIALQDSIQHLSELVGHCAE